MEVGKNWKVVLLGIGIVALLALLPLMTARTDVLTLVFLIMLYIILSQSWNILGGYTGQVNLGHAAFFGVGALTVRYLWLGGWFFPLALLAGAVMASVFALIIGVPAFRLRGIYFVIGTLVLAEILRIIADTALPVASVLPAQMLAFYDLIPCYYLGLGIAVMALVVVYLINESRLGLALMAVREDEEAASTSGVCILRYKLLAFLMSSALAGLAGGVFALYAVATYAAYLFEPIWTFDALIIVYIGGVGTILGPVIGSAFFVCLRQLLSMYLPGGVHLAVFGVLFIIVVLFLPGGLTDLLQKRRS